MSNSLKIKLLGRPHILQGDSSIVVFHKAQALFYYLSVTGRMHPRSTLIDLFWAKMSETNGKNNLRVTLSYLRKKLGNYLTIDRNTVSFNQEMPYWLDVTALKTHLRATPKNIDILEEAVSLYRGPFLEGFHLSRETDFEEWVLTERRNLHNTIVDALHTLTVLHKNRGSYEAGIGYANQLLSLENWREETHRLLMILLASSGQRTAAVEQYRTCQQILDERYGISPSPETDEVYQDILSNKYSKVASS
jgi:DNA-binding SARP family transcriptional activator